MDEQNTRVSELGTMKVVRAGVEDPPEPRTDEIRAEIEQAREDISETVNAIQDRLRPSTVATHAAENVRRAAAETARDVANSDSVMYIRANPIPTALIGAGIAGLAWLAMRGSSRPSDGSFRRAEEPQWGSRSPRAAPSDPSEYTAPREKHQLLRIWDQNPVLIGAGAAVLGAIVAYAIPETAQERQLMGTTRDTVIDTVRDTVSDRVQDVASNALGIAQSSESNTQTG